MRCVWDDQHGNRLIRRGSAEQVLGFEWTLARSLVVAAIALGVVFGGCGGSGASPAAPDGTAASPSGNETVRPGAPGSISVEAGNAVPLGISPARVIHQLGQPAVSLRRKDAHYRCMFYDIAGQPPTVQLQYCFAGEKLKIVASYIRGS
jgi:hypothetical protein